MSKQTEANALITASILRTRKAQRTAAEKQIKAAQDALTEIDKLDKVEAAEPKAPSVCVMCGAESKAWGDRGGFGIQHTIGGIRALCHNQTSAPGLGCWGLYQKSKQNVLMMKGVKVGQHGKYNKPLADRLLTEEVARLISMPKHRANIACQFEAVGLTSKTGQAIWNAKIETELAAIQQRLRGGQAGNERAQAVDLKEATRIVAEREAERVADEDIEFVEDESEYHPPTGSYADQVQREKDIRDKRDSKKKAYVNEVPGSEGK